MIIKQFLEWKHRQGVSEATAAWYRHKFVALLAWMQAHNIDRLDMDGPVIPQFLTYLKGHGRSPYTIRGYWKAFRELRDWMVERNLLPPSNQDDRQPSVPNLVPRIYEPDDVGKILKAIADSKSHQKEFYRAIVLFLLSTGVRRGELCRLDMSDINMETSIARIYSKKVKREHVVSWGKETDLALHDYLKVRGMKPGPLFINAGGSRLKGFAVNRMITWACKRAGVPIIPKRVHAMRATFSVEFCRQGGNLMDLMACCGWTSLAMPVHYSQFERSLRAAETQGKMNMERYV